MIEPIDGTEGMSENFRRMLPWLLVGGVVMWMVIAFTVTHLFIFAEEVRYDWGTDDLTRAVDRLNNEPMMYHPKACWRILQHLLENQQKIDVTSRDGLVAVTTSTVSRVTFQLGDIAPGESRMVRVRLILNPEGENHAEKPKTPHR